MSEAGVLLIPIGVGVFILGFFAGLLLAIPMRRPGDPVPIAKPDMSLFTATEDER